MWIRVFTVLAILLFSGPPGAADLGVDGQPCSDPIGEICTNFIDDDGNGLIDCFDPQCNPEGSDFLCDASGVVAPACQPLLDDPAKMKFKPNKPLDLFNMSARIVPTTPIDPVSEDVRFGLANVTGALYQVTLPGGVFVSNRKGTTFKFKRTRTKTDPILYLFVIRERFNRQTGAVEYIIKPKLQADLSAADPNRNPRFTETELVAMRVQVVIGNDPFLIAANWTRERNGWFLPDKVLANQ